MQIWGEATWRRGLCCFFFSQYFSLFACKTGSKIKKHAGGSTRGGVPPNGGGYVCLIPIALGLKDHHVVFDSIYIPQFRPGAWFKQCPVETAEETLTQITEKWSWMNTLDWMFVRIISSLNY